MTPKIEELADDMYSAALEAAAQLMEHMDCDEPCEGSEALEQFYRAVLAYEKATKKDGIACTKRLVKKWTAINRRKE